MANNAEKPEIFDFIVFRASSKSYENKNFLLFGMTINDCFLFIHI